MKKTVMIIPYFGKFPTYFNIFLKSCSYNKNIKWLFFTNDRLEYNFPKNTETVYITFQEIINIFKKKLGENIVLNRPHKLCDYKVTYGYVFEEWIKEYDYWGHCDVDVIYGNLIKFIEPLYKENYDKIFSLGHFSLYRNVPKINKAFERKINGKKVHEEIFSNDYGYAFDEWHCRLGGINQIFLNREFKFFPENYCADLNSSTSSFQLSNYSMEESNYNLESNYEQIFSWKDGVLIKHFLENGKLKEKEYPYIHFHKRKMKVKFNPVHNQFLIVPNEFLPINDEKISTNQIVRFSKKPLVNRQYLKVKYINILYRLKLVLNKFKKIYLSF